MPENNTTKQPRRENPPPISPPSRLTTYIGTPLLLEASVLTGGIAALEIRRADNLISSTTLHLVWSTRMAFLLPVAIG